MGEASAASTTPIERTFREESGKIVANLIRVFGDFDLAEDSVQEAFEVALEKWPVDGYPDNPAAWITTTARRRAIDKLRRRKVYDEKSAVMEAFQGEASVPTMPDDDGEALYDDRLRLIFTCCHPALAREAQVALTLKTLSGLTTPEVASAFLVPEPTMAQRIVRAKRKIKQAAIPYRVPPDEELPPRLSSVLAVLYLVFNEGYGASAGDSLIRQELCEEAIRLTRVLASLMSDQPEVKGLLALMLLQDSRREARTDASGDIVLLEAQDRSAWNREQIAAGQVLVQEALTAGAVSQYQFQAAIAAVHSEAAAAEETDWPQIAALYRGLERLVPSPVVRLNMAVAHAMADGPDAGLKLMDELGLGEQLAEYPPVSRCQG
jgi:RNA polymerase sigma-70 factor (ECF subfamily)